MSDNSFQVYTNGVVTLAQTIVIKSEYIANVTNDRLLQFLEYKTDLDRPETWKYYMNLAGEYHPTDTPMIVISSDNLDEIEFNKTNLIRHRNTARDYQFGTRQYGELLEKYPGQEDLILGILYPIDKDVAISAPDHKILGYPKNLIQVNEYTLLEELQKWTDLYFKRYYNWQYTISDSMYYSVVLSMYYMNLVPAIMNARLKKHKTIEAHSFYVSQYLASNSNLGGYYPFMSLEQSMHFYRNIRYYQRHAGMNQTLDKLIDALMTKRLIPMASYTMRHDTTDQLDNIYPEVMFKRTDMTSISSAGTPEFITTDAFLTKEIPDASGNDDEIAYSKLDIEQYLKDSPSNVVQTKLLESAMIDYAGAVTYKLEDIQLAHWLYYSHLGKYTAIVNVPNPKTNERITLSMKDAYILATYCVYRSMEMTPTHVPLVVAERVQRYPIPSDVDLKSVVDMNYVTDFSWNASRQYVHEVSNMISIDDFYEKSRELYKSSNYQRDLISFQEGMHHRGEVYKLVERYYADQYIRLVPAGTTYEQWLQSKNMDLDSLKRSEFEILLTSLVATATGVGLSTSNSLRNIQRAMASALRDLSSYSIQVVTKMSDEAMIVMDFPSIRGGTQEVTATNIEKIRIGDFEINKQDVSAEAYGYVETNIFSDVISHETKGEAKNYMDIQNGPHLPARGAEYFHQIRLSQVEMSVANKPDVSGTSLQPLLGMNWYMGMTPQQKASLFEQ